MMSVSMHEELYIISLSPRPQAHIQFSIVLSVYYKNDFTVFIRGSYQQ